MRRKDRELTDFNDILQIIDQCDILRIGLADGDFPYIVPLNFAYTFAEGALAFYVHGAMAGRKYELMKQNGRCSFEMDLPLGMERTEENTAITERYRSVMGAARIEFLEGEDKRRAMEDVILSRYPLTRGFAYHAASLSRCAVAKLSVLELSAKENLSSPDAPSSQSI